MTPFLQSAIHIIWVQTVPFQPESCTESAAKAYVVSWVLLFPSLPRSHKCSNFNQEGAAKNKWACKSLSIEALLNLPEPRKNSGFHRYVAFPCLQRADNTLQLGRAKHFLHEIWWKSCKIQVKTSSRMTFSPFQIFIPSKYHDFLAITRRIFHNLLPPAKTAYWQDYSLYGNKVSRSVFCLGTSGCPFVFIVCLVSDGHGGKTLEYSAS